MATSVQRLAPLPEITRHEQTIFKIYVVMAALVAAFLTTTVALWALGV
jgi:hypothetical protein